MNEEHWARVDLDVELNVGGLGALELANGEALGVKHALEGADAGKDEELNHWPVDVEEHGGNEGAADLIEPLGVEVRDASVLGYELEEASLLAHVGVHHKQKEGCVEELHDEDAVSDQTGLLRLGVLANVDDELDDDHSQDEVDGDDANSHSLVGTESFHLVLEDSVTDGVIGVVVSRGVFEITVPAVDGTVGLVVSSERGAVLNEVVVLIGTECPEVIVVGVEDVLEDFVGLDHRVDAGILDGVALAEVDCEEGANEEANNNGDDLGSTPEVVGSSPVAVLPDNVGRLSRLVQEEVVFEEEHLGGLFLSEPIDLGLELLGNDVAVFLLKGNEGIDGSGELTELISLEVRDLLLNLAHFVIASVHDVLAAHSQELNEFGVRESEDDVGNLYSIDLDVIFARSALLLLNFTKLLTKNVLELILDVSLEALTNGDVALSSLLLRVDAGLEVLESL